MNSYLILIFVQVLFGLNFVSSKIVVTGWNALGFASIRFLVSGLFLLGVQMAMGRSIKLERSAWRSLFFLAFLGLSLSQWLFLKGLGLTTATNTSLIASTIPVFVFAVNGVRGLGQMTKVKVFGLLLSFAGVLILRKVEDFNFSNASFMGDLLVMAGCFLMGWSLSYSQDFFKKHPPLIGSAHMFWLGGALLLPLSMAFGMTEIKAIPWFWSALMYSIFGATCLTYLLNNLVLTKINSNIVGLFIFLQPVVASLVSYTFLGEDLGLRKLISFAMIALGVMMVITPSKKA
jgi:drug/metabolite transporter (DMT)-like permease